MELDGVDVAISLPFISKHFEEWAKVVYLRSAGGHLFPVARRLTDVSGELLYEACADFILKFRDVISMGATVRWTMTCEIDHWLDRIIYLSFLSLPEQVTSNCWFRKVVGDSDSRDSADIPKAYHGTFGGHLKEEWVLLKNKGEIWPVRVTDNRFYEGWSKFWDDHKLCAGLTIVFGARIKSVFEVVIIGPNGRGREYNWAPVDEDVVEFDDAEGILDGSLTSCLPGIFFGEKFVLRFGFLCEYGTSFDAALAIRLEPLLMTVELENVAFVIQSKKWIVPVVNNVFERIALRGFARGLKLIASDYVFVNVVEAQLVRLVIFGADGLEKLAAISE